VFTLEGSQLNLYGKYRHKGPKTCQERDHAPPEYGSFLLDFHGGFLLQRLRKTPSARTRPNALSIQVLFESNELAMTAGMELEGNQKDL
jgi:hypothetical protein